MCQPRVCEMSPECVSAGDETLGGSWGLPGLEPLVPPGCPVHPELLWARSEYWWGGREPKSTGLWPAFAWEQVLGWCLPGPQISLSWTRGTGLGGEEPALEKGCLGVSLWAAETQRLWHPGQAVALRAGQGSPGILPRSCRGPGFRGSQRCGRGSLPLQPAPMAARSQRKEEGFNTKATDKKKTER